MSITIAKNRVKRLGIGAVAAAAIVLSGCSTGALNDDYSAPSVQPTVQQKAETEPETNSKIQPWSPPTEEPDWCKADYKPGKGWDSRRSPMLMKQCEAFEVPQRYNGPDEDEGRGDEWSRLTGGDDFEDRCEYDPTMNYDWHDDWVCDGERPYLLPDDEFVDQEELEQAAREYIS